MLRPTPPRVFWDEQEGWTIETTFALSKGELLACVNYTRRIQEGRAKGMRGDKREQALKALSALSVDTLKQRVIAAPNQERTLYSAR